MCITICLKSSLVLAFSKSNLEDVVCARVDTHLSTWKPVLTLHAATSTPCRKLG